MCLSLQILWILYEDQEDLAKKTIITAIHANNFGFDLQREKSAKLLLGPIALSPPCYAVRRRRRRRRGDFRLRPIAEVNSAVSIRESHLLLISSWKLNFAMFKLESMTSRGSEFDS